MTGYNTGVFLNLLMRGCGEADGPQSVWQALRECQPDRIGHGTRAIEDPALVSYLLEHNVPVEMCPISNCRTQVVRSLHEHPIDFFLRKNGLVSVNTDDPLMFQNSLQDEYSQLSEVFCWSEDQFRKLLHNAIVSSWASDDLKQRLTHQLETFAV